jgi:hypothetical protein
MGEFVHDGFVEHRGGSGAELMIEDYCTSERQRPRKFLRCTKYWHIVLLNFKWYQASFRLVMPGNAGIDDFLESTMEKGGWVYIMTKHANGTFYIGVTSDPIRPISQHRDGEFDGLQRRTN